MERRAAQFTPFAALTGYYDLVRKAETDHDALYLAGDPLEDDSDLDGDLDDANIALNGNFSDLDGDPSNLDLDGDPSNLDLDGDPFDDGPFDAGLDVDLSDSNPSL